MKRFLVLIVVVLVGCGESEEIAIEKINEPIVKRPSIEKIIKQINASGKITAKQAESLSKVFRLEKNGLTSITDEQAAGLSKGFNFDSVIKLDGLLSITDAQAGSLSKWDSLSLNGLTTITDKQAKLLSLCSHTLSLNGLTSITDAQAESLSARTCLLYTSPRPRDRG